MLAMLAALPLLVCHCPLLVIFAFKAMLHFFSNSLLRPATKPVFLCHLQTPRTAMGGGLLMCMSDCITVCGCFVSSDSDCVL